MRNLLHTISFLLIFVGVLLLFERPAYAYTDPGTGLLAIQAAGSAMVAAGWYLRRKIYALFHRGASRKPQPGDYDGIEEGHVLERDNREGQGPRVP